MTLASIRSAVMAADDDTTTASTGNTRTRFISAVETPEGQQVPVAASLLLLGGLALSSVLSGTGTMTPIADQQVRYIGGWTSTARTLGARLEAPGTGTRPSSPAASPAQGPAVSSATVDVSASVADPATDRGTQAAEVRWLHETSGLTWEQLGRAFGVSRRAVHLWANGARMNATNAETLFEMVAVVRELPGATADERRAALLATGADGRSVIDRFRARHAFKPDDVSGTPFRPDELLGARHGDVAET